MKFVWRVCAEFSNMLERLLSIQISEVCKFIDQCIRTLYSWEIYKFAYSLNFSISSLHLHTNVIRETASVDVKAELFARRFLSRPKAKKQGSRIVINVFFLPRSAMNYWKRSKESRDFPVEKLTEKHESSRISEKQIKRGSPRSHELRRQRQCLWSSLLFSFHFPTSIYNTISRAAALLSSTQSFSSCCIPLPRSRFIFLLNSLNSCSIFGTIEY